MSIPHVTGKIHSIVRAARRLPGASPLPKALCLLAAMLAFALPALGKGEAPPDAMDLVWKGVNLAVLLSIIVYFARKPVASFFRGAAAGQKESYDAVRKEADHSAAELEAQKTRIAGLESELERMVEAAKADAAEEREQLSRAAEAQAERIRTQARIQVEQEFNKATMALKAQLADDAVRLAEELIRSRLDDDRRQQLVSDYIQQLGARQ